MAVSEGAGMNRLLAHPTRAMAVEPDARTTLATTPDQGLNGGDSTMPALRRIGGIIPVDGRGINRVA